MLVTYSRLCTLTLVASTLTIGFYCERTASASELLPSRSAQGYLGVGLMDVDNDRAAALKLKDARGAEIITIDQDAPAAKAGLKVHDVVVQMNGQRIEGVEQFRRMLHETPPGRTVSLSLIRDGQTLNLSAALADRAAVAKGVIVGLGDLPGPPPDVAGLAAPGFVPPGSGHRSGTGKGFLDPFRSTRYYVGIDLQPLPTGLAEYFGVRGGSGLLVGNVFPNSPGAAAGLRPADVIQKVNGQPIVSLSDWQRALRINRGKQVQITLIRDKKEQTLSMVAGEARNISEMGPGMVVEDEQTIATLNSELAGLNVDAIRSQVQESLKGLDVETLRKESESLAKTLDSEAIEKAVEQGREQWKQNEKQLEDQLRDLTNSVRSRTLPQMD